jgi:hypothetical protein
MMNIDAVHLAARSGTAEETKKVLNELEAELADTKARRDKILVDIARANERSVRDQRERMKLPGLNKQEIAAGRLIVSIQHQVSEARKRVAMVHAAEAGRARAAELDNAALVRNKLYEVTCPDGRKVRHRGASQEDVQRRLQAGYSVAGQVHGADADGNGGFIPRPGFLTAMLEAYEGEFETWLAKRGIVGSIAQSPELAGQ